MKLFKQILLVLRFYIIFCSIFGLLVALFNIGDSQVKLKCDKFYAAEFIFPVTPIACLLSKQVAP